MEFNISRKSPNAFINRFFEQDKKLVRYWASSKSFVIPSSYGIAWDDGAWNNLRIRFSLATHFYSAFFSYEWVCEQDERLGIIGNVQRDDDMITKRKKATQAYE